MLHSRLFVTLSSSLLMSCLLSSMSGGQGVTPPTPIEPSSAEATLPNAAPAPVTPPAPTTPPPAEVVPAATSSGTPKAAASSPSGNFVSWERVLDFAPLPQQDSHPGLSGTFAGPLDATRFLVAGGTYFPKPPLEGGKKTWSDQIMMLQVRTQPGQDVPSYSWAPIFEKLPQPLAGGLAVPTQDGLLCIGGCDSSACRPECFLLSWDESDKKLARTDYPPLPSPLAWHGGGLCGQSVIVVGGCSDSDQTAPSTQAFALDLSQRGQPGSLVWEKLPPLPEPRLFPVCVAASDGRESCLYVMSGRAPATKGGEVEQPLTDILKYTRSSNMWSTVGQTPHCVMGGTAVALEAGRVLVMGGDDGEISRLLDRNARRRSSPEEQAAFTQFNQALIKAHPGYRRGMWLFDPRTDAPDVAPQPKADPSALQDVVIPAPKRKRGAKPAAKPIPAAPTTPAELPVEKISAGTAAWKFCGIFPMGTPALAHAMLWDGAIILAGGETRPGERSTTVWMGKPETP